MRKFIAAGLAALTFAGSIAVAGSANAQSRHRHHDNNDGAAIAAGIAGLAVGAAIASSNNRYRYYDPYAYPQGRYSNGYYYGPRTSAYGYYGYNSPRYRSRCRTTLVWDPYWGQYVERTRCRR